MLQVVPSFVLYLVVGTVLCAVLMWRTLPGIAGAALMALAFMSPTWLQLPSGGNGIDVRAALAIVYLVAFCIHPAGRFRFKWNALDTCIALLFLVAIISDAFNDGFQWYRPILSYGELLLPFYAGRFLLMRPGVQWRAAQWFAIAGIVVSVLAMLEAVSGTSIWETLLAPKDDYVTTGESQRYGLWFRATGPTRHPIFLSIVLTLCIPWCISLIGNSYDRWSKTLGGIALVTILAGMASTLSRGAIVSCVLALLVVVMLVFERTRIWISLGVLASAILAGVFWDRVVDAVVSTQDADVRSFVVNVNGKPESYTGTNNRLFILKIYGPKVIEAGPLGFGTERTSQFPPDLPGLSTTVKQSKLLSTVDNSYVLFGLRYGWLGLAALIALFVMTIFTCVRLRATGSIVLAPDVYWLVTSLAGILAGVMVTVSTVFSCYDFFFWLLFSCGLVAGLRSWESNEREQQAMAVPTNFSRRSRREEATS